MSVFIYSFPKSGNFLAARAFLHSVERNIYRCLLAGNNICDIHHHPAGIGGASPLDTVFGPSKLQPPSYAISTAIDTELPLPAGATHEPLKSNISDSVFPPGKPIVYKSHTKCFERSMLNDIDGIVVLLRRPTAILRSHVAFQYLEVSRLDDNLDDHAIFVYKDQLGYMEALLTLRPCLELSQDGYMDVIFNSLLFDKPVIFYLYDEITRSPSSFCASVYEKIYGVSVRLPSDFDANLSKANFLAVQEKILNYFIATRTWSEGLLGPEALARLTKWAYDSGFRVINGNERISKLLQTLEPAAKADSLYELIKARIPNAGLLLKTADERALFRRDLLDSISAFL